MSSWMRRREARTLVQNHCSRTFDLLLGPLRLARPLLLARVKLVSAHIKHEGARVLGRRANLVPARRAQVLSDVDLGLARREGAQRELVLGGTTVCTNCIPEAFLAAEHGAHIGVAVPRRADHGVARLIAVVRVCLPVALVAVEAQAREVGAHALARLPKLLRLALQVVFVAQRAPATFRCSRTCCLRTSTETCVVQLLHGP